VKYLQGVWYSRFLLGFWSLYTYTCDVDARLFANFGLPSPEYALPASSSRSKYPAGKEDVRVKAHPAKSILAQKPSVFHTQTSDLPRTHHLITCLHVRPPSYSLPLPAILLPLNHIVKLLLPFPHIPIQRPRNTLKPLPRLLLPQHRRKRKPRSRNSNIIPLYNYPPQVTSLRFSSRRLRPSKAHQAEQRESVGTSTRRTMLSGTKSGRKESV
jgi:hypothetical protein